MASGRFTASIVLALTATLAACDSSPDPLSPDPIALKGRSLSGSPVTDVHTTGPSVTVTVSSTTIPLNEVIQATAVLQNGDPQSAPAAVWSTSDATVARINQRGQIVGDAVGTATVTATIGGVAGSVTVTVSNSAPTPPPTSGSAVTVTVPSTTILLDQGVQATAVLQNVDPQNTPAATWSTSDATVARVNQKGQITGDAIGTATITAVINGNAGSVTVTVSRTATTPPPTSGSPVTVTVPSTTILLDQGVQATAVLQNVDPQNTPAATWSTSDATVARVNQKGQITGDGVGTATITAVINGNAGSVTVTVSRTATAPTPPTTEPVPPTTPTNPVPPTNPTAPPSVDLPSGSGVRAITPELPRASVPDAAYVPSSGRTIRVSSGGDLQGALNSAQPGDQVLLAAGAQFVGNFTLPPKATGESCSAWVEVTTETSLPPAGTRVTPASAASFAKIITPNQDATIKTAGRGSCYRIVGVELTTNGWDGLNYGLVVFGDGYFDSLGQIPHGIVLDRVYLHGQSNTNTVRCVALNSVRSAVINSWITDCHARGFDSQAIEGWNGPGPYLIENNFLGGAGENIMFGGADPRVSGLTPSDITIRRNHIWKDPSWKGVWVVKNLFELKHARRVLFEGNVLENNWADGQSGMAIVLKTLSDNGSAPWTTTQDVTIRYNVIRNSPRGFNVQGMEGNVGSPVARVRLEHNLFENIGNYNGTESGGWLNLITHTPSDIAILHNTMSNNTSRGMALMMDYGNRAAPRFQLDDNVFTSPTGYALFHSGMPVGNEAMNAMSGSSWSYARNVTVGVDPLFTSMHPSASWYPSMSEAGFVNAGGGDYRLGSSSPYKGKATDGRDPGVDFDELNRRTAGVVVR